MLDIIKDIPDLKCRPLEFVMKYCKPNEDSLWLEFGVATGGTINYISTFTNNYVYGFDSFEGLPEFWRERYGKGSFTCHGNLPKVNNNVVLIKGLFEQTVSKFLTEQDKKISFIHVDCDLYSSTKLVFQETNKYMDNECVIVFDELLNYDGFDGPTGELRAFYEFIQENDVKYEWIGMNGKPLGLRGGEYQSAAVKLIKTC